MRPSPPLVTYRAVFAISVPMTFAYLSTPLIGVTDMAVIGQLGDAALIGAVAMGAVLFDFIGTTMNFLRTGTTGLVAQAMGAGDAESEAVAFWRALMTAVAIGVATLVLQGPVLWLFLRAMGASAAVAEATTTYFSVRVWAMPFMLANYAVLGWLLGLGRARAGLALQLVLGIVNIVLSVALVLGLRMGVAGVALASVLAEAAATVAGGLLVARGLAERPTPSLPAVLEHRGLARLFAINRDILIRSLILVSTFSFFAAMGARLGDVTLAANAVLLNIFMLGSHMLDGYATAAEQLGGRAVGARDRAAFDRTVVVTSVAGVATGAALSLIAFAGGNAFVALMTTAEAVREAGAVYLVWAALTPLAGALAFTMDGLYIGATWSAAMRNMMLVSGALFVAVWWLATPLFGNHGLWLALLVFLGARGLTLALSLPAMRTRTFGTRTDQPFPKTIS
ncbi:MATE family efflux transporter [Acuticoccus mangrovi]|uniref:MATE family efflux transporter n=1 Tax=Acuticoccus mangrovi TaxID=2796142 RepID=A0A934IPQ0_9HYPH|nr:MATE family efflux transporter [Acuticoccus mangrovi]MBJ3777782.1 MATE family efflux transporter [Acuticoccus mangrovi]